MSTAAGGSSGGAFFGTVGWGVGLRVSRSRERVATYRLRTGNELLVRLPRLCDGGGSCGVGGGGGGRGRKDAVVIYRCGGVEKGREEWRSGNLGGVWRVIAGAGSTGSYGERKLAVEASIPS